MTNLLSNAIKYNRAGGRVQIEVRVEPPRIAVAVVDSGKGIAAERMPQLFKPFERLETDPNVEGTGLGLALVYSIVEEHYGQITIDSPADIHSQRGTRIRVTLPRHVEATSAVN